MIQFEVDIEGTDDGELVLEGGDFKLATVSRSVLQAIIFVAMTDYGEYSPEPLAAGNLGSFIGATNSTQTRERMRTSMQLGIDQQGLVKSTQISIAVVPLGLNEALVTLRLPLVFQERDISDLLTEPLVVGFVFPYESGTLEKIDISN